MRIDTSILRKKWDDVLIICRHCSFALLTREHVKHQQPLLNQICYLIFIQEFLKSWFTHSKPLKFSIDELQFLENWRSSRGLKGNPILPVFGKVKCDYLATTKTVLSSKQLFQVNSRKPGKRCSLSCQGNLP